MFILRYFLKSDVSVMVLERAVIMPVRMEQVEYVLLSLDIAAGSFLRLRAVYRQQKLALNSKACCLQTALF